MMSWDQVLDLEEVTDAALTAVDDAKHAYMMAQDAHRTALAAEVKALEAYNQENPAS